MTILHESESAVSMVELVSGGIVSLWMVVSLENETRNRWDCSFLVVSVMVGHRKSKSYGGGDFGGGDSVVVGLLILVVLETVVVKVAFGHVGESY